MFIPRHPVVENQFCSYAENTSFGTAGVGGVVCYAGSVLYLDYDATNQEPMVMRYDLSSTEPTDARERIPFGFAEQKVKVGYHQVHPAGFMMPGDLGSSDVIAQPHYTAAGVIDGHKSAPIGVAHLGIWDTVHYRCEHTSGTVTTGNHMVPGDDLYVVANAGSAVTNHNSASGDDLDKGERLTNVTTKVARVLKGASAAKCSANIGNTTLYPIRIKLLI
jgi:hypothetical protein